MLAAHLEVFFWPSNHQLVRVWIEVNKPWLELALHWHQLCFWPQKVPWYWGCHDRRTCCWEHENKPSGNWCWSPHHSSMGATNEKVQELQHIKSYSLYHHHLLPVIHLCHFVQHGLLYYQDCFQPETSHWSCNDWLLVLWSLFRWLTSSASSDSWLGAQAWDLWFLGRFLVDSCWGAALVSDLRSILNACSAEYDHVVIS